jgi:hypothetical protein
MLQSYKGHFTIWPSDLTLNFNGSGEISKNWKFGTLNWEFLNFEAEIAKVMELQGGLSEVSPKNYYYYFF